MATPELLLFCTWAEVKLSLFKTTWVEIKVNLYKIYLSKKSNYFLKVTVIEVKVEDEMYSDTNYENQIHSAQE